MGMINELHDYADELLDTAMYGTDVSKFGKVWRYIVGFAITLFTEIAALTGVIISIMAIVFAIIGIFCKDSTDEEKEEE